MVGCPFFLPWLHSSIVSLLESLVLFPGNTDCITSPGPNTEAVMPVIAGYGLVDVPSGQ